MSFFNIRIRFFKYLVFSFISFYSQLSICHTGGLAGPASPVNNVGTINTLDGKITILRSGDSISVQAVDKYGNNLLKTDINIRALQATTDSLSFKNNIRLFGVGAAGICASILGGYVGGWLGVAFAPREMELEALIVVFYGSIVGSVSSFFAGAYEFHRLTEAMATRANVTRTLYNSADRINNVINIKLTTGEFFRYLEGLNI